MQILRSIVFNIYFFLICIFVSVFGLIFTLGTRRFAFTASLIWEKLLTFGTKYILGLTYRVEGRENLPEGACIIASKHQSTWETIAFCGIFPYTNFVAKRELLYIPFINIHFWKQKTIMLNRKLGSRAKTDMVRQAKERVAEGDRIVIYPEGTRKAFGDKPKYKLGIAAMYEELGVPVVPVALNSGYFWGRRSFAKKPGVITVSILPAIQPGLSQAEFMKTLEDRIETRVKELNAQLT